MCEKKPLIIIAGPTAVGKSALSIALAKEIGGEIISADSMQVYRHMDIGSAKITPAQMEGISHHLLDILEPEEEFHVVKFQTLAKEALDRIDKAGRIPIVVGGTGFYIQSVLYDIDFTETKEDTAFREELEAFARKEGTHALFERLRSVDPKSCEIIHEHNIKRVIRAIEFYEKTGTPISEHNERQQEKTSPYQYAYFVLTDERARLYERIDRRVDEMVKDGLVEEVMGLKNMGCTRDMVSMQGLGYKEILEYLEGNSTLEDAIYRIKRDTRHFAKRQLTWFRREKDVLWVDRQNFRQESGQDIPEKAAPCAASSEDGRILAYMLQILIEKGILSNEQ
ncbi:MAG: tRNA (adenosine(37)-N6)-dimethylallyltransferase MiaA [Blautia sp.]|nr:tRNA (adenosine(37)-N6)-dimethylallyltransferase MiaA [Lachnoclostridium sp.]MCM1210894.1 tRNA (adenosine(37)-N6)-dimethylallyltransferase MiaA [Blautia sp.]